MLSLHLLTAFFLFFLASFFSCVASVPADVRLPRLSPRQERKCLPEYGKPVASACMSALQSIPSNPLTTNTFFGGPNSGVVNPFYLLPKTFSSGNCEIKLAISDDDRETEPETWESLHEVVEDLIDDCVANGATLSGGTDVAGPDSRIEVSIRSIVANTPGPSNAKPQPEPSCGFISIPNIAGVTSLVKKYCNIASDCASVAGCTCKPLKFLSPQLILGTLGAITDSALGACGA